MKFKEKINTIKNIINNNKLKLESVLENETQEILWFWGTNRSLNLG